MNDAYFPVKSNYEIRAMAREQLRGNWGMPILVCILYAVISGFAASIPYLGWIGGIVISGPMALGLAIYFLKFCRSENPTWDTIFEGFKLFGDAILLFFLIGVFTFLWSLLLIVPGIIAAISYSQAYYILHDSPGISPLEAIRWSKEMMRGYKLKYFTLLLSFIGWAFLCALTFGIGYIWLFPYVRLSLANFYNEIRGAYYANKMN